MRTPDRWTRRMALAFFAIVLLTLHPQAQPTVDDRESYSERAERALIAGDLGMAIDLYQQWLEADPDDFVSWYNYASALALRGDSTRALSALQTAVDMGWRDSTWAANDPDLLSLHSNDRFKRILSQIGTLGRKDERFRGDHARYATQVRLAPYELFFPFSYERNLDEPYPLVILLHDRGQDMAAMVDIKDRLALPGIIYALPRAPHAVDESGNGFEYWPRDLARGNDSTLAATARAQAGRWVGDVAIDVTARTRVDSNQVFVIGFGQGGAAAYLAALENPAIFRGVASLGGFLPVSHRDSTRVAAMAAFQPEIFIGHGRRDRVIKTTEAERARDYFQAEGLDVSMHIYPAEHNLPDEMVVDLADWILRTASTERPPVRVKIVDVDSVAAPDSAATVDSLAAPGSAAPPDTGRAPADRED